MRVLFSSRPAYGHIYPMLPLALALRDGGDQVAFATGRGFVEKMKRLGFPSYLAGESILWAEEEAIRRDPALGQLKGPDKARLGQTMFSSLLPPRTAEDLVGVIENVRPDLVIYEMGDFGAAVAAAVAGIPCAVHTYGSPWPDFMSIPMRANLRELWAAYGFEEAPVDEFYGDVYLDISPPSLGDGSVLPASARIPLRPTAFSEPGQLPAWLTDRARTPGQGAKPLAYVTLGTVVFERVDVIRAAIDGLAALDVDAVVAVGPEGSVQSLGHLPPGVHAEHFVPQDRLLRYVDLVVHHCGSGTMLGALALGIPQLALPQGADQFVNAEALARAGAAIALMPEQITPQAVSSAARSLLGEASFREAAETIRDEISAMPSPAAVAQELGRRFGA